MTAKKMILIFFVCALAVALWAGCAVSVDPVVPEEEFLPGEGTTLVPGGVAMPYADGDGIPEMTATPTFTPDTLAADGTVTVNLPVDTDTVSAEAYVDFVGLDNFSQVVRFGGVTAPGTTAAIAIPLAPFAPATQYTVTVILCAAADCQGSAVSYNANNNYFKNVSDLSTSLPSEDTGVAAPTFLVTASTKGTQVDPVIVALDTLTQGFVQGGRSSYYQSAATSGSLYSVALSERRGEPSLGGGCSQPFLRGDTCVQVADSAALDFQTSSSNVAGGVYKMLVREHLQGTAVAPLTITPKTNTLSAVGSAGTNYYQVAATATKSFSVTIFDLSADVNLHSYDDDSNFTTAPCEPNAGGKTGEGCDFVATGSTVYFKVDAFSGPGATYRVVGQPAPPADTGTILVPATVPFATATAEQVLTQERFVTPVSAGERTVTLSNISYPTALRLYDANASFGAGNPPGQPVCSKNSANDGSDVSCTITATGPNLYYEISANGGSYFTITVN